MKHRNNAAAAVVLAFAACQVHAAEIVRYPLPNNSTFPIAQAVELPAGTAVIFVSGTTPAPADPKAETNSPAYWGNTKAQSASVLERIGGALKALGLGYADVVKMTVFLVGDPAVGGRLDFAGFMEAYTQFFGTPAQPKLPARTTVQVAGLNQPGMLVEVEVVAARPGAP